MSGYAAGYSDVKSTAWYGQAVTYAQEQGYMQGVGGGRFAPQTVLTRGTLATVLYRLAGDGEKYATSSFADNIKGKWYFDAVEYCYRKGIVTGYGNDTFGAEDALTRQDMMVMLYRYAKMVGEDNDHTKMPASFADRGTAGKYARKAVAWCLNNCVINGTDALHISPQKSATRAQLAQVMMNYDEWVRGISMAQYRKSSSNPYGISLQGARLDNQKLHFRLAGLPQQEKITVSVSYKIKDQTVATESRTFSDCAYSEEYTGNAAKLYASDYNNMGLTLTASMQVTVQCQGTTVYKKSAYLAQLFQNAPDGTPLYYKGQKTLDSRIFLYHEFTDNAPPKRSYGVITTPAKFKKDIQNILQSGYTIIPLNALIDYQNGMRALPEKSVILTMDDGYLSNYTKVFPILKKYGIHATIFVSVSTMGVSENSMTWAQMQEMENSGLVDIQAHSWRHDDHTQLSTKQLHSYFADSYAVLEKNLKKDRRILAYPYGRYNDITCKIAGEYDVVMQMTTDWKALDMDCLDLTRVPRLTVDYGADISQFLKVSK